MRERDPAPLPNWLGFALPFLGAWFKDSEGNTLMVYEAGPQAWTARMR